MDPHIARLGSKASDVVDDVAPLGSSRDERVQWYAMETIEVFDNGDHADDSAQVVAEINSCVQEAMSRLPFPIAAWGIVSSVKGGRLQIERVRVDRAVPCGFIIITEEPAGTLDVWVETEAEVMEYLALISIQWDQ